MTVSCHSCQRTFADYKELAMHISSSRKGHRRGKRWASKYMMINGLSAEKRFDHNKSRTPLTKEDKENLEDTKATLSGETEIVPTKCPKCKRAAHQQLPVEYTRHPLAWCISRFFMVLCPNCRVERRGII